MTIEEARKLLGDFSKNLSDEEVLLFEQFCRKLSRTVIRYNRKKRKENKK